MCGKYSYFHLTRADNPSNFACTYAFICSVRVRHVCFLRYKLHCLLGHPFCGRNTENGVFRACNASKNKKIAESLATTINNDTTIFLSAVTMRKSHYARMSHVFKEAIEYSHGRLVSSAKEIRSKQFFFRLSG